VRVVEFEGGDRLLIRLDRGDEMMRVLRTVCAERKIEAGRVRGIGALRDVQIGYFDVERKEYARGRLTGSWELLSLEGNIALRDGEYVPHVHVILGGPDFECRGGHLFAGVVSVTGEIFVDRLPGALHRAMDPEVRLPLLDL
jgi:predicted DNA-binding protein with PD1-like motif